MKYITVNEAGLELIHNILKMAHTSTTPFTKSMLAAWASDVEESFARGNGACFEIPTCVSVEGRPMVFWLDLHHYDVHEVADD